MSAIIILIIIGWYIGLCIYLKRLLVWLYGEFKKKKHSITKKLLLINNVTLVFSLLLWPIVVFASLFMFDAPGSDNLYTIGFFASVLLYPIPIKMGFAKFRKSWETDNYSKMYMATGLVGAGPLAIGFFVFLINSVCNGYFACR